MKNVKNKGNFKTDTNDLILHDVKSPTSRGAYFKYLSSKSVAKTRNFNLISYWIYMFSHINTQKQKQNQYIQGIFKGMQNRQKVNAWNMSIDNRKW